MDEHERSVEPVRREPANGLGDVLSLPVHGDVGSELPYERDAVRPGGGGEDPRPHPLRELHGEVSDPAARAEHQQRLSCREVELIVEAAQRGDPIRTERPRLLGAQSGGDRGDLVLRDRDVLGVEPALEAVRVDAIADAKALRPIAQGDHLARSVVADDLRERALPELDLARADVRVPDADPGAVEPDEDLVTFGLRHRKCRGVEDLGPSEPVHRRRLHLSRNRCLHGRSPAR